MIENLNAMNTPKGLTAFVVDDNPQWLDKLAGDLRQMPDFSAVHTFSSYTEATLPLLEIQPDVLFLDVEVPGRTGLEFLESIRKKVTFSFKVVFYSAYSHYMLDAIRQSAFDYLLKPYKKEELRQVVSRLLRSLQEGNALQQLVVQGMPRKIALQTISELLLVTVEQILMFNYQSKHRTWQLVMTDLSTHTLKKGMTAESLLSLAPTLARINSTCIINLSYLEAIENTTQHCRLCPPFDRIGIIASRRYFSKLKERFELL